MKRYTYWCDDGKGGGEWRVNTICGKEQCGPHVDRLATIEDILGEDYDLDRLRELVEADRDGRCVVMPVKVGDTVYDTTIEDITGEIGVLNVASVVFFLSKTFNRLDFHAENYRGAFMTFEHRDIGKSVFRTREAAEAALKGEAYGG